MKFLSGCRKKTEGPYETLFAVSLGSHEKANSKHKWSKQNEKEIGHMNTLYSLKSWV